MNTERRLDTPELRAEALVANNILSHLIIDKKGRHVPIEEVAKDRETVELVGRLSEQVYIPTPEDVERYTKGSNLALDDSYFPPEVQRNYFKMTASQAETQVTFVVPGIKWHKLGPLIEGALRNGKTIVYRCMAEGALDARVPVTNRVKRIEECLSVSSFSLIPIRRVWSRDLKVGYVNSGTFNERDYAISSDRLNEGGVQGFRPYNTELNERDIVFDGGDNGDLHIQISRDDLSQGARDKYAKLRAVDIPLEDRDASTL